MNEGEDRMARQQSLSLANGKGGLTDRDVYQQVDIVLEDLRQTGNIDKAIHALDVLDRITDVSAHAKAQLLWGMKVWWDEQGLDEEFTDFLESRTSTNKATVVERYINAHDKIQKKIIPASFAQRPMREIIPVTQALTQGYEISDKNWERLLNATGQAAVQEIVTTKIKGRKQRKQTRQITWERDGSLYVIKDNVKKFLGYFDKKAYKEDQDVYEAINYLLGEKVKVK